MSEEYKSIREEMLKSFTAAEQLVFFSIVSLGALYSWLATQVLNTSFVFDDPFFFVIIGLFIIFYTFSKYLHIHKRIYNQGSYLVAYYEISTKDKDKLTLNNNKWHILSRIYYEVFDNKKIRFGWGSSGKANAFFLFCLGLTIWFAPIYLMIEKINFCVHLTQLITLIISIIISVIIIVGIIVPLWRLNQEMYKTMSKWISFKDKIKESLDLNWTKKFKAFLEKEETFLAENEKFLAYEKKTLADKKKTLEEEETFLEENEKILADKKKTLADKKKALAEEEKNQK